MDRIITDRERLEQIRKQTQYSQVLFPVDTRWLLGRRDALGTAFVKTDPFVSGFDDYCLHCEWIAGEDGIDHASDCIYGWAESVYGEPDAAGAGEQL